MERLVLDMHTKIHCAEQRIHIVFLRKINQETDDGAYFCRIETVLRVVTHRWSGRG